MKATMERHQHNSTTSVTDRSSARQVKRFDLRRSITSGPLRTMLTGTGSGFQMALLWTGSRLGGGPWVWKLRFGVMINWLILFLVTPRGDRCCWTSLNGGHYTNVLVGPASLISGAPKVMGIFWVFPPLFYRPCLCLANDPEPVAVSIELRTTREFIGRSFCSGSQQETEDWKWRTGDVSLYLGTTSRSPNDKSERLCHSVCQPVGSVGVTRTFDCLWEPDREVPTLFLLDLFNTEVFFSGEVLKGGGGGTEILGLRKVVGGRESAPFYFNLFVENNDNNKIIIVSTIHDTHSKYKKMSTQYIKTEYHPYIVRGRERMVRKCYYLKNINQLEKRVFCTTCTITIFALTCRVQNNKENSRGWGVGEFPWKMKTAGREKK